MLSTAVVVKMPFRSLAGHTKFSSWNFRQMVFPISVDILRTLSYDTEGPNLKKSSANSRLRVRA